MKQKLVNFLRPQRGLFLLVVAMGGYSGYWFALHLASLADPSCLVKVTIGDIFGALPLGLALYMLGCMLALRFPIRQTIRWYSVFFIIRVLVAIVMSWIFLYDDERGFHIAGMEQPYGVISIGAGTAYYHLVAILYEIFGANILLPKMFNAFIGALLPFIVFDITNRLFGSPKVTWRAFLLTGLLPPFIFFSAVTLKEILTSLLLLLVIWCVVRFAGRPLLGLVCVSGTIGLLYWVRGAPVALLGLSVPISYYVLGVLSHAKRRPRLIVVSSVLIGISLWVGLPLVVSVQEMVLSRTTAEAYFIERFTESEATVTRFLDVENPLHLKNLGVLFLRGLYSPSPLR